MRCHRRPTPFALDRGPSPARARVRTSLALVALLAALFGTLPAAAQVDEWAVHGGLFDFGHSQEAVQAGLEARLATQHLDFGRFELPLQPGIGAFGNDDGAGYAYLTFRVPLAEIWSERWPERWRVVPFTGVGIYTAGDSKDLGGPVEFRSGLDVDLRLSGDWWLGLSFYHLSNGVLYDLNPGEESLVLQLSWR